MLSTRENRRSLWRKVESDTERFERRPTRISLNPSLDDAEHSGKSREMEHQATEQ
jgi:hypothetical protein